MSVHQFLNKENKIVNQADLPRLRIACTRRYEVISSALSE